jgi:cell division protein FtsN
MSRTGNGRASGGTSSAGFLMGLILGLVLGLAVALGIAFYLNKTPIPFATRAKPPAEGVAQEPAKLPAIAGMPQQGAQTPPGKAGEKGGEKSKFDFYKILPGGEEPVSDRELKDRLRAPRDKAENGKDVYYVQAGSFQNPAEADALKGRIAMLGLESSVEPAHLADKGTWYRVRLGPYTKVDELNRVRQSLAQSGIDASLIKLKDASTAKKGN